MRRLSDNQRLYLENHLGVLPKERIASRLEMTVGELNVHIWRMNQRKGESA